MSNPYTNPFCSQSPIREVFTLSSAPKESSAMLYVVFFSIIMFILLIAIAFGSQMSVSYEEPYVIKVPAADRIEEYKNFVAPKNGTVKLSKGVVTQTHHSVKEDSVIILSRKSIDGKAGTQLVIKDITPNKKFTIHSINSEGDVETDDCGEVYFAVI